MANALSSEHGTNEETGKFLRKGAGRSPLKKQGPKNQAAKIPWQKTLQDGGG